jgi:drug/metabolite transporter (DMT)-like permease
LSRNWKSSSTIALIALVGITAVWGGTFLIVQKSISRMPVMDFLAMRFSLAALVMLIIRPTCLRHLTWKGTGRAVLVGIALALGYISQTFGLLYASAAVSGFITGMYVVLTPVIGWIILRNKTSFVTWSGVALATVGLGLISLRGWSIGPGELLTLACAFFYAIHIIGLGEWSSQHEIYSFSLMQVATVAIISLGVSAPGGIMLPPDLGVWIAVGITAILATALAFLVQTWAQSLVSPVRAAVVMTMEPVFAGVFGVFIGGNQLTPQIIAGATCVLAAMLIVQIKPRKSPPRLEV